MENQHLNIKLLETSIGAMQRNRALLFTINLIAALIIVLVYLENYSVDKGQNRSSYNSLSKSLQRTPRRNEKKASMGITRARG